MSLAVRRLLLSLACGSLSWLTAAPVAAQIPPEVAANGDQWPLPNRDYASTRAVFSDSHIDASTIDDLSVVWEHTFSATGFFGAVATNPLILDDTIYYQDLESNVFVLDLATGATLDSKLYGATNFGPNGLAVGYGKIFLPKNPKEIAALDIGDLSQVWSRDLTRTAAEGMTIQPLVYDGRLFLSTVPGSSIANFYTGGTTGRLHVLDVDDGASLWDFDTVDTMHLDPPHIWIETSVNSGGGAWYPPSIDLASNTTYWGTGNPAPFAGTPAFPNGSSRLGDNLYTNCVLALDHADGNLDWYHQAKSHDLTDADNMITPVLATVDIGGAPTDVLVGTGKHGIVFGYDRDTGSVLWTRPVGVHANDTLDPLPPGTTLVTPGVLGGVETPMSYADGVVFVPVVNLASPYDPSSSGIAFSDPNTGTGETVAIDVTDGSVVWQQSYDAINLGATTVINDLVLTATYDGVIRAHDRATGVEVWSYATGEPINAWPAVAGDTLIVPTRTRLIAFRLQALPVPSAPAVAGLATALAIALSATWGLRRRGSVRSRA